MTKRATGLLDTQVGTRLRELRRAQGVSQAQLGELLGVSFQQVQKYEAGTNRVSTTALARLAQIFELPISYFLEAAVASLEDDKAVPGNRSAEGDTLRFLSANEAALVRYFRAVTSSRQQRLILALVGSMAAKD